MSTKFIAKLAVWIFDVLAIPLAWYLAYWLRFNMRLWPAAMNNASSVKALLLLSAVQIFFYYQTKVSRGLWRYASMDDLKRILHAVSATMAVIFPLFYLLAILPTIPRSILPLYAVIVSAVLCAGRFFIRSLSDKRQEPAANQKATRVIVVGAGQAGQSLIRDLKRNANYKIIGLVDDDSNKLGLEVHGILVLGKIEQLIALVTAHQIDMILLAIPSIGSLAMRRIVDICTQCKVPFHTLPSIQDLASGRVEINALRKVKLEDLLGRDQVKLSWAMISDSVAAKTVLITGGGGSIGAELCRQVAKLNPRLLLILDNSEYHLYRIGQELRQDYPRIHIQLLLISVTDAIAVEQVLQAYQPEILFHAAAYKHVPMLEHQIRTAVLNNVIGTQIVAKASAVAGVGKFILISTDKAVNPSNIMGTTKRVAEIYCQNLNEKTSTQFITVRFGNVLGSMGSVVPLFQEQLERGGPLTVTHPDIMRYFMTIPEACQLILQAMACGVGGEIFVLDMGEPVKISYLAEQMIRLAGKEPGKDIAIQYTGLRPGEKLFEELFHDAEALTKTDHKQLFKAQFRKINWDDLLHIMHQLQVACDYCQSDELLLLLKQLVPEFQGELLNRQHISGSAGVCLTP